MIFLIPKHHLITSLNGKLDAHCQDAVNFAAMRRGLEYAKRSGNLISAFDKQLDQNIDRARALSFIG